MAVLDIAWENRIPRKIFLQDIYNNNLYPDIISIHPYTFNNESPNVYYANDSINTFKDLETIKKVMDANSQSDKKIWITEFGWQAGNSNGGINITEALQTDYINSSLQIIEDNRPFVEMIIWFWDHDGTQNNPFAGYGLIRYDNSIRPAGQTFKDFIIN